MVASHPLGGLVGQAGGGVLSTTEASVDHSTAGSPRVLYLAKRVALGLALKIRYSQPKVPAVEWILVDSF
jgi:hypothetical protein